MALLVVKIKCLCSLRLARHLCSSTPLVNKNKLLASERSERDTYRGNTSENRGCLFIYLYICMDVRKAFLYFDPRVFVLVRLSTPSQIALNRILWFIDQYPYHPKN